MNRNNRGVIENERRAKQLRDFSGLRYETITPSDIDASVDFHGRMFVAMEAKYLDQPLGDGQRKHYEYKCQSHWRAGDPAMALHLRHFVHDPEIAIDFAVTDVVGVYLRGPGWLRPKAPLSCREAIDRFVEKYWKQAQFNKRLEALMLSLLEGMARQTADARSRIAVTPDPLGALSASDYEPARWG